MMIPPCVIAWRVENVKMVSGWLGLSFDERWCMDLHLVVQHSTVAAELGIGVSQVDNVVQLADEGNTVPFITRYRKELTGNLDEEQIRAVLTRVAGIRQLAERADTIT